jgi:hypothetical protein
MIMDAPIAAGGVGCGLGGSTIVTSPASTAGAAIRAGRLTMTVPT